MSLLKRTARAVLHHGGMSILRSWPSTSFRILTYHRFPRALADTLELQCRYISKHYEPVTLDQIGLSLDGGPALPRRALAVTIDDGYEDIWSVAAPIFGAHGIRPAVYLVSGFVDGELWLWWDQIAYAIAETTATSVCVADRVYDLGTASARRTAAESLSNELKKVPDAQRRDAVLNLAQQLQVRLPAGPPARFAPLKWEVIRQLRGRGFVFGAHTRSHPILSRVETSDQIAAEIHESRARIEEQLGEPVSHFSYPNGQTEDIAPTAIDAVSREGFQTAVTTQAGVNKRRSFPFLLNRLSVAPSMNLRCFVETVAGLRR